MTNKSTSSRRPAEITKCPYCDWKGSARGLHSHARLLHNKNLKNAREIKSNPYVISSNKKKETISGVRNKNTSIKDVNLTWDNVLITIGVGILAKWLINEIDNKTFQSECNKLKIEASNKIRTATQV